MCMFGKQQPLPWKDEKKCWDPSLSNNQSCSSHAQISSHGITSLHGALLEVDSSPWPDPQRDNSNLICACYPVSHICVLASLVQTDIKRSLFNMDAHQGAGCRRSLITCWEVEGSQHETIKMLPIIIQVSLSAQHIRSGVECFPAANSQRWKLSRGRSLSAQVLGQATVLCESFQDRGLSLFIPGFPIPGAC